MIDTESYVEFAMETARNDVAHHRSVLMNATVIDSQGEMVIVGANNLQTDADREGWYRLIKQKVAEFRGQAVVLTAGVSRGVYTDQGRERFKELAAQGIHLRIDDSVSLGLCNKVEAIMVGLYTPLQTIIRTVDYKYVNGKAVFGEEIVVDSNQNPGELMGLFANFFEKAKAAKPS